MGVSAAYGPIFLWLQHPSAQQYSVSHSSRDSPCRTTRREPQQGWGAKDLRLCGRHTVPRGAQAAQGLLPLLAGATSLAKPPQLRCFPRHKDAVILLHASLTPSPKHFAQPPLLLSINGETEARGDKTSLDLRSDAYS